MEHSLPSYYIVPSSTLAYVAESQRRRRRAHLWGSIIFFIIFLFTFKNPIKRAGHFLAFRMDRRVSIPSDVTLGECAQWIRDDGGYLDVVNARFELPLSSSDDLLFISRGSYSIGTVSIDQQAEGGSLDKAIIDIEVEHIYENLLDKSEVCLVRTRDRRIGLGIFTPTYHHHNTGRQRVRFNVHVHLPYGVEEAPFLLRSLTTEMPMFLHKIGDIGQTARFDRFHVFAANARVVSNSLTAAELSIQTSNGAIEGTFNTSSIIWLYTSNGHINVELNLLNVVLRPPTQAIIHTSNGTLESKFNLESTIGLEGGFVVTAHTSNGRLGLDVLTAPVDSKLFLDGKTSMGSATLSLPPTYEGGYVLSTSLSQASVVVDEDTEDPAYRGRKRILRTSWSSHDRFAGLVGWSIEGVNRGNVVLSSSLSRVTMTI